MRPPENKGIKGAGAEKINRFAWIKVQDLKPKKDAKGGGSGGDHTGHTGHSGHFYI